MIGAVVSFCLCMQFASFSLLRSMLHDTTPVCTVLFYVELLKFAVSLCMMRGQLKGCFSRPFHICAPILIYTIMNMVSYIVIAHIPASTYVMLLQLKLPMTCIVSCLSLSQRKGVQQTIAILLVCISCANIVNKNSIDNSRIDPIYVLGTLLECALSAISSVYMQIVFENDIKNLWIRNLEFSFLSLPIYTSIILFNDYPWTCTRIGYMFSGLGALGGILVALSLIFTDAIEKTLSSSLSIIVVTISEHVIYRKVPSFVSISFYAICLLSVLLYSSNTLCEAKSDEAYKPLIARDG